MDYNKLQQEAIDSTASNIIVSAPPGSGKTYTLIGAIKKYLVENEKANVVAITFTVKAADELGDRIRDMRVRCSTIHSWCYKELNKLGLKYKFKVSILKDNEIKDILNVLSRECGYYTLNMFKLFAYIMGNYNIDVSQSVKNKFDKVARTYIKYKRDNKLYDFTDLPLYLFDVLNEFNETIDGIDALFVDEFQDVDEIQQAIFEKVTAEKRFFIGDEDQSIYLFRMNRKQDFSKLSGFEDHTLNINYRSYQEIIDYANTMISGKYEDLLDVASIRHSSVVCIRGDGGTVNTLEPERNNHMSRDLVDDSYITGQKVYDFVLERMLNHPYILCRTNKQVKAIKELGYEWVSTIHQAKGLEYKDVIVVNFPLKSEEDNNVAYVGVTRAKDSLIIANFDSLIGLLSSYLKTGRLKDKIITGGKLF